MGTIELFWRLFEGLVESGMKYGEGMMESTQLVQSWRFQVSPFNSSHVHKGKWSQGSSIQPSLWSSFPWQLHSLKHCFGVSALPGSFLSSLSLLPHVPSLPLSVTFLFPWVFIFDFYLISPQRNKPCPCFTASLWLRQEGKGSFLELHQTQPSLVKDQNL